MTRPPHNRMSGRRTPSDAEARLFDAAMKDVVPLAPPERKPIERKPVGRKNTEAKPAATARTVKPSAPPAVSQPLAAGAAIDVDARTMLRLKRGRIRPEGRLDLHGMTQEAAHRALGGFIAHSRNAGRRCVIVITGTGRWREGAGVLREQVPKWLSTPPLRDGVIGFATAQPADGGAGALYVLLRRYRTQHRTAERETRGPAA